MKRLIVVTLVLATCLSLCACGFSDKKICLTCGKGVPKEAAECIYCGTSTKKKSEENAATLEGSANEELSGGSFAAVNANDYTGYWRIRGDQSKELAIHSGDSSKVYFSLWYYRAANLSNVPARLEGNVATFSLTSSGEKFCGTLTFHDDYITLRITESSDSSIPTGVINYTQRHSDSLANGTAVPTTTTAYKSSEYILPYSSSRYLTYEDIRNLSSKELRLARNEIYARHGRLFKDDELQRYFNSKSWYFGRVRSEDFTDSMLSAVEKANIEFIRSYE